MDPIRLPTKRSAASVKCTIVGPTGIFVLECQLWREEAE
jgi:hypothetical protein